MGLQKVALWVSLALLSEAPAPMLEHLALAAQHAVMSADVSELQVAAAHGALALAELYSLLVAPPPDPVWQKFAGVVAMVEHLAAQHVFTSVAVQVNPAQSVSAAPVL